MANLRFEGCGDAVGPRSDSPPDTCVVPAEDDAESPENGQEGQR